MSLRPLRADDAAAVHAYRSPPLVCAHLSHDPMTPAGTRAWLARRLPDAPATAQRLVRGLAVELDGAVVGDAMLRVAGEGLRIGYALHPRVWGRGIGTDVARALVAVGRELGLPVLADVMAGNGASLRVLAKAGLVEVARTATGHELRGPRPPRAAPARP